MVVNGGANADENDEAAINVRGSDIRDNFGTFEVRVSDTNEAV